MKLKIYKLFVCTYAMVKIDWCNYCIFVCNVFAVLNVHAYIHIHKYILSYIYICYLVVSTHLKKILAELDIFPDCIYLGGIVGL